MGVKNIVKNIERNDCGGGKQERGMKVAILNKVVSRSHRGDF